MVQAWRRRGVVVGCGAVLVVLGCGGQTTMEGMGGSGGGAGAGGGSGGLGGSGATAPTACAGVTPSTAAICFRLSLGDEDSPCQVELPPPPGGQTYRYDAVHVLHTTASGAQEEVPRVANEAACSAAQGGWYASGTTIMACPCTCASFETGAVTLAFEC